MTIELEIVKQFARKEVTHLIQVLGRDHEYFGVEGVNTIGDIEKAINTVEKTDFEEA